MPEQSDVQFEQSCWNFLGLAQAPCQCLFATLFLSFKGETKYDIEAANICNAFGIS